MENIDKQEVKKFSDLAADWWNENGDFKPLHVINPLRANYIKTKTDLTDKNILDVGCGGGILSEALHDFGGIVTGIDAAGPGIEVAKVHAKEMTLMCSRNATTGDFMHVMRILNQFPSQSFITHNVLFSEMIDHFDSWLDPLNGIIKATIDFN